MYADARTADDRAVEFAGRRSDTYKDALSRYRDVWIQDIACMDRHLAPQPGERILEVGAGSGYFSRAIAERIGPSGLLAATDPSIEQLAALADTAAFGNVEIFQQGADRLDLPYRDFDAVWSRGSIHHVLDKTSAFKQFALHTRPGGRLVIADIFSGTPLARYFDIFIARSCCTGHEVAYLSREFAETLCLLTGWDTPSFVEAITPWEFETRQDIGRFLHLLFSATDAYTPADCLEAAETLLSVSQTRAGWALMWPMTVMVTHRRAQSS